MGHAASIEAGAGGVPPPAQSLASAEAFLDQSWQGQVEGSWRTARAKELDQIGGPQRMTVKRGDSLKFRLQCLQVRCSAYAFESSSSETPGIHFADWICVTIAVKLHCYSSSWMPPRCAWIAHFTPGHIHIIPVMFVKASGGLY